MMYLLCIQTVYYIINNYTITENNKYEDKSYCNINNKDDNLKSFASHMNLIKIS